MLALLQPPEDSFGTSLPESFLARLACRAERVKLLILPCSRRIVQTTESGSRKADAIGQASRNIVIAYCWNVRKHLIWTLSLIRRACKKSLPPIVSQSSSPFRRDRGVEAHKAGTTRRGSGMGASEAQSAARRDVDQLAPWDYHVLWTKSVQASTSRAMRQTKPRYPWPEVKTV